MQFARRLGRSHPEPDSIEGLRVHPLQERYGSTADVVVAAITLDFFSLTRRSPKVERRSDAKAIFANKRGSAECCRYLNQPKVRRFIAYRGGRLNRHARGVPDRYRRDDLHELQLSEVTVPSAGFQPACQSPAIQNNISVVGKAPSRQVEF
jgi:hypothetical protein